MKNKVHFSLYCKVITVVVVSVLIIGIIASRHQTDKCILLTAITFFTTLAGLYYCPMSVTADSDSVKINRLLSGNKTFKYSDIESVDSCYPCAGGLRICGSSGFFGYWGYFSDVVIGSYFGYYADRSQCFFIKLKNKRQYVISCENHIEIVKLIQSNLK
ncbi:MAG: PH domain-containing protein [Muribaculaceae bacterium]|nr:PH domain-containing protein [Muribaculaceae bacterium]